MGGSFSLESWFEKIERITFDKMVLGTNIKYSWNFELKKTLLLSTLILASLSLAACGRTLNNSQQTKTNSSLRAENSSLKGWE